MEQKNKVFLFMDEEEKPLAVLETPVRFELDTERLSDGVHVLKIVSQGGEGKEGIRLIPFTVKNGPSIEVEGIKEHAIVDGTVNIMINAYGKANPKTFLITGSETPQSIPYWVWITIIVVVAWGMYYMARWI
ncbi:MULTISPECIES: cytochrome C [unclassified Myroides]|uniref:cytochrome C n=1 Tax=unclassified Myroides TaxID=2642485 RepID=UPI003D2F5883